MQCRQFLANTRQTLHPSREVTSRPPVPRPNRKATLQHRFGGDVEQFLNDEGVIPQISYKRAVKTLNTEAVAAALSTAGPNRLLGTRPPAVDPSEATLPQVTGSTLSQLRSDFCKDTGAYKLFIDSSTDGSCPLTRFAGSGHHPQVLQTTTGPRRNTIESPWLRTTTTTSTFEAVMA
jgi:hypothetical protein